MNVLKKIRVIKKIVNMGGGRYFLNMFFTINGSDLIDSPWTTTFSVFTDLLGNGFYLVPISVLALALYIRTRNPVVSSVFMMGSGLLLSSGSMFMDYPEMVKVYVAFTAVGLVGSILSVLFMNK